MVKKIYYRPTILPLEPEEDPEIPIGGSQGTSGDIDMFSFASDVPENIRILIELNCDDIDYADIDGENGDYVLTYDEIMAWINATNPPWWN